MNASLHILTRTDDLLAREIITRQEKSGRIEIAVADLTKPELDYKQLLDKIFAAETVQVW